MKGKEDRQDFYSEELDYQARLNQRLHEEERQLKRNSFWRDTGLLDSYAPDATTDDGRPGLDPEGNFATSIVQWMLIIILSLAVLGGLIWSNFMAAKLPGAQMNPGPGNSGTKSTGH